MLRGFGSFVLAASLVSGCNESGRNDAVADGRPPLDAANDGAERPDDGPGRPDDGAGRPDDGVGGDAMAPLDAAVSFDAGPTRDAEISGDSMVGLDASPDPDAEPCAPSPEVCDGQDQDCDGTVDEHLGTQPCDETLGACAVAVAQCQDGTWQCDRSPAPENCDGAEDDDCDGATDEGCDCIAGERRACGDSTGACQAGEQACFVVCDPEQCLGTWGSCEGGVAAAMETCDGRDEDCDGVVDEALMQVCGLDEGRCQTGVSQCVAGGWGVCVGAVAPREELCDGTDDDCDGEVDERALLVDLPLDDLNLNARVLALGGAIVVMWDRPSQFSADNELMLARFDWNGQPLAPPQSICRLDPGDRFRVLSTGTGALLITDRSTIGLPAAPEPCATQIPHLFALNAQGQITETLDCGAWLWSREADDPLVSNFGRFYNTYGTLGALVGRDRHSLVSLRGQRPSVQIADMVGSARLWGQWLRPGRSATPERVLDGARLCATNDVPACGTPAVATTAGGLAVALRDTEVIRISFTDLAGQRLGDAVEVPADGIAVAVDLGDTAWVLWGTDRLKRAQVDAYGITVIEPVDVAVGPLLAAVYDGRLVTVYGRRADGIWSATIDRQGTVIEPARLSFREVDPGRYSGPDVRTWLGELGVATLRDRRAWLATDNQQWRLQIDSVVSCGPMPACAAEPEACDGVDDDCDGAVDEAAPLAPGECLSVAPGACGVGDALCQNCSPSDPTPEVACNLVDEDCDGAVHDLPATADAPVCLDRDALVCRDARYVNFCRHPDLFGRPCQQAWETILLPDDQRLVLAKSEVYSRNWALTAELEGQPDTRRLLSVRYYSENLAETYTVAGVAGNTLWMAALTSEGTSVFVPPTLNFALIRVPVVPGGLGNPIETPLPTGDVPSVKPIGQWSAAPTLAVSATHVALAWVRPDIPSRPGSVWLGVWNHAGAQVSPPREVVLDPNLGVAAPRLVAVPGGFLLFAAVRIANPPARQGDPLDDGYRIRAWPLSSEGVLGAPRLVAELRTVVVWSFQDRRYGAPAPMLLDAAAGDQGVLLAWGADAVDQPAMGVRTAFVGFDGGVAAPQVDHRPVSGDTSELGLRVRATREGFLVLHEPNVVDAFGPTGQTLGPVAVVEAWAESNEPLDLSVEGNRLWFAPRSLRSQGPPRVFMDLCE